MVEVYDYRHLFGEKQRFRPASRESWAEIEAILGVQLPMDYKDFVDGYGDCIVAGHLYIPHPQGKERLVDWIADEVSSLESLVAIADDLPDVVREQYSRFIPWGYHDWDGDTCYFLPPLDDEGWSVVVAFRQCHDVLIRKGSFADFLESVCSGEGIPRSWPKGSPVWESVEGSPLI